MLFFFNFNAYEKFKSFSTSYSGYYLIGFCVEKYKLSIAPPASVTKCSIIKDNKPAIDFSIIHDISYYMYEWQICN